jgi:DNA-binding PadR family transcriptional regulator
VLTELEGAILSEVSYRGRQTTFQVRKSFADSPSLEWKGSAGAVYAAVNRLHKAGMLSTHATGDRRATKLLSVTPAGRTAMMEWACDPHRAISTGIDPFRIRSGIWLQLSASRRDKTLTTVREAAQRDLQALQNYARKKDTIERASVDLAARLQQMRIHWFDEFLKTVAEN